MTPFENSRATELESYALVIPYMEYRWQDADITSTSSLLEFQKFHGDFIVRRPQGIKTIELKAERFISPNLFLETWSNREWFMPGWMLTCHADWLWYVFLDHPSRENSQLYIMPVKSLKQWAFGLRDGTPGRIWSFAEKQVRSNQLNDCWGRVVPIEILVREVAGFVGPIDPRERETKIVQFASA